jgi:hypothetical protein
MITGRSGHKNPNGEMMALLVDFAYLTARCARRTFAMRDAICCVKR